MSPGPPFPKLPPVPPSPIKPLREIVRRSRQQVEKARDDIRSIADDIRGSVTTEPTKETKPAADQVTQGTACIPCSRDHLSVTSSALSEGIRFAREKGVRDPEVTRRIRIALDELNAMERIDLAPAEIIKLKGAEKELADWTLKQSRGLRHAITSIKDVETMEQAAAGASQVTEEFMGRLWGIPEEECETCGEIRESIRQFIERRKRERAGIETIAQP